MIEKDIDGLNELKKIMPISNYTDGKGNSTMQEIVLVTDVQEHCITKKEIRDVVLKDMFMICIKREEESSEDFYKRIVTAERNRILRGLDIE